MSTKCQAVNREKKPCPFSGSKKIGNLWLCGNHAIQALGEEKPIKTMDLASIVASAIHNLYQADLGNPEVVSSILRNAWES